MSEADAQAPMVAGRYQIVRRIARGGMADVYLARDVVLDRPVAIKMMFANFAAEATFVERFRREAQAAGSLNHPNIAGVYDWGAHDDTYYIAMEYVDGQTLATILRTEGAVVAEEAARITKSVALALGAAHRRGIVHRDVKPSNIIITPRGEVKVTDFGIAQAVGGATGLTDVGQVIGTAEYLSPEQARGQPVDPRSDLYALGVVLFEMVTGQPPFSGNSPAAIAHLQVFEPAPSASARQPSVPPLIDGIIDRLLAKHPEDRYATSDELIADLDGFRNNASVPRSTSHDSRQDLDPTGVMPEVNSGSGAFSAGYQQPAATAAMPASKLAYVDDPEDRRAFDDDTVQRRSQAGFYAAIAAVLIVGLVGALVILGQSLLQASADELVIVPSVVGDTEAAATASITDVGLLPIIQFEPRDDTEPGIVFAQNPEAETELARGDEVIVFVSAADETVVVPNVLNKTVDAARDELIALGFVVTTIEQPSDTVEAGLVASQSLSEGQEANAGATIALGVSSGPEAIVVPSLANLTQSEAEGELAALGLTPLVELIEVGPGAETVGRVISQSPAAGRELASGEAVTIRVAKAGPTTTTSTTTTSTTATTSAPTTTTTRRTTTSATQTTTAPTTTAAPSTTSPDTTAEE